MSQHSFVTMSYFLSLWVFLVFPGFGADRTASGIIPRQLTRVLSVKSLHLWRPPPEAANSPRRSTMSFSLVRSAWKATRVRNAWIVFIHSASNVSTTMSCPSARTRNTAITESLRVRSVGNVHNSR